MPVTAPHHDGEPPGGMTAPCWDDLIASSGLDRLDARVLLEHVSGRSRTWLLAHGDEPVPTELARAFETLRVRRARGEPLAYLTGVREFMGHRFAVSPAVLVPRPETEHLVEAALTQGDAATASGDLALAPGGEAGTARPLRLLDLGTGSGAIAVSLALARPGWQILASDRSASALEQAQANARSLGASGITWWLGDWWHALPCGSERFDLIVSNPPYLAEEDPHLHDSALAHEPLGALVSGPSGLEAIEVIIAGALGHLRPQGWLMIEHGHTQGSSVRQLMQQAGFEQVQTQCDLAGLDRVTMGQSALRRSAD